MRRYNYGMPNNCRAKIEVNKFYMVFAGPPHPAFVYEIDKKHKTIKSIKFGTTKAKHMTEIHPLQDNTDIKQYVHNRPFEGTIKDYGDKELVGLSINELDFEVIEEIKKREPNKSRRAKLRYK